MSFLSSLVKIGLWWILVYSIYIPLWRRSMGPGRRLTRWRIELSYVTFLFSGLLAPIFTGALNYIPKVGRWFSLGAGDLKYFDARRPAESIAGFLLVNGTEAAACALVVLVVFGVLVRVDRNSFLPRVLVWLATGVVATWAEDWLARRWKLPDPHETDFAPLWSAVAKRMAPMSPDWRQGLLILAAGWLSLAALALLIHLTFTCRQGETDWNGYRCLRRGRLAVGISVAFAIIISLRNLGPRLFVQWLPDVSQTDMAPSWHWIEWNGMVVIATAAVVFCASRLFRQNLQIDTRDGGRLTMVLIGLLWSTLAAAATAAVAAYAHEWKASMLHAIPGYALLRYAVLAAAQSLSVACLLIGYIAPTVNVAYGRGVSLLTASAGYAAWFGYSGCGLREVILLLLTGCFLAILFWFTRTLWAPVAFQIGWWILLGPLLGFSVAPLKGSGTASLPLASAWGKFVAAHLDGSLAMIVVMALSLTLLHRLSIRWSQDPG